jgi:hypothetical protein
MSNKYIGCVTSATSRYLALNTHNGQRRIITAVSMEAAKRKLPYRGADWLVQPYSINKA